MKGKIMYIRCIMDDKEFDISNKILDLITLEATNIDSEGLEKWYKTPFSVKTLNLVKEINDYLINTELYKICTEGFNIDDYKDLSSQQLFYEMMYAFHKAPIWKIAYAAITSTLPAVYQKILSESKCNE